MSMSVQPDGRAALPSAIVQVGVVAIGRNVDPARVEPLGAALMAAGLPVLELTLNDPEREALDGIERLAGRFGVDELVIGAGTVLTVDAAERAVGAGARFLVTPHTDPVLIAWAAGRSIPILAGALSPTEVLAAWRSGAAAVKVFPASQVGATGIREIRGPLPDIPLVPTGGVTVDVIGDYIRAGATAVALGGGIVGPADLDEVTRRARAAVAAVAAAREAIGDA
jgi:2-dehydro-3-deoxyphosphogluconate aldolase/(4S)-4-hydroxy-2-oxoglutarate aldolase